MSTLDAGVTGLALCAFLGAGYTDQGGHEFAKVVRKGLAYLLEVQDPEGCVGPRSTQKLSYSHATATLALVEAAGLTEDARIVRAAQRGLGFIALARNPQLAWRYGVKPGDNDTSVTGWMCHVLAAARWVNEDAARRGRPEPFPFDTALTDGALTWLRKVTLPFDGRVGYALLGEERVGPIELDQRSPAARSESLTALALFARIALLRERPAASAGRRGGSRAPSEPEILARGIGLLEAQRPAWNPADGSIDLSYWYWGSLALHQVGGEAWSTWSRALVEAVLPTQRTDGTICSVKGSWDPVDVWGPQGGRIYSTAVLAMCLETPYRYPRVHPTSR